MSSKDWTRDAALAIGKQCIQGCDRSDLLKIQKLIELHCPFKKDGTYVEVPPPKVKKLV